MRVTAVRSYKCNQQSMCVCRLRVPQYFELTGHRLSAVNIMPVVVTVRTFRGKSEVSKNVASSLFLFFFFFCSIACRLFVKKLLLMRLLKFDLFLLLQLNIMEKSRLFLLSFILLFNTQPYTVAIFFAL